MKAVFDPRPLSEAFAFAASAAPSRSPMEALRNVKLVADGDGARLVATDLEVAVTADVAGVEVAEPGAALLPADRFAAILKTWGGGPLPLSLADGVLRVGSGRAAFRLTAADAAVFPDLSAPPDGWRRTADAADLATALRRTTFACDAGSARYALGGVLFEPRGDGGLDLVATDGRRLAVATVAAEPDGGAEPAARATSVVPLKAAALLARRLVVGRVAMAFSSNAAAFRLHGAEIWTRLVEGRFPAYRDAIPADPSPLVAFRAGDLRTAVQQAAITTSVESAAVDFGLSSGRLTLSSSAADVGEAAVELDCHHAGPPVAFALNARFAGEMLRALGDYAAVSLRATDARSPVLFEVDDGSYRHVIMPMSRDVAS